MVREARKVWRKDFTFDSACMLRKTNCRPKIENRLSKYESEEETKQERGKKRRKMFDKNCPSTNIFPFVNGNLKEEGEVKKRKTTACIKSNKRRQKEAQKGTDEVTCTCDVCLLDNFSFPFFLGLML
ncbi:hypothetical protein TWF718_001400 [Orbilia javanica]|uniref:Uncharacterized protein n=1 Tax=Orbilia javanica TaxID=47235 RepID=A0AAN8RNA3_9PEZI